MGEKRASAQRFDTCAVENVIDLVVKYKLEAIMVIKRAILGGYAMSTSNFQWRHDGLRWHIKLMQNIPTASLFYCRARQ